MTRPTYDYRHKQARKTALARMNDGDPCCRCGRAMYRGQHLDLDHNDRDPTTYNGLCHRTCNRSAGATKGNRLRGTHRRARPRPRWMSRAW